MSQSPAAESQNVAICLGCNYPLRGLSTTRCPECGRAFDPADPRTMHFGRPIGRVGRFLIRPLGWPIVLTMAVSALATSLSTGVPDLRTSPRWVDLRYFFPPDAWRDRRLLLPSDYAYSISLYLFTLALIVWFFGTILRALVIWNRKIIRGQVRPQRNRQIAFILSTLVMCFFIFFGWPQRLGRSWAANRLWNSSAYPWAVVRPPDLGTKPEEIRVALAAAARQGRTPALRLSAMRLVVGANLDTRSIFLGGLEEEPDPRVRATRLHLAGLSQELGDHEAFLRFTHDSNSDVRAAAADAIGLFGSPRLVPNDDSVLIALSSDCFIQTNVEGIKFSLLQLPIWRQRLEELSKEVDLTTRPELTHRIRSRLKEMLVSASDPVERDAAARGLVAWPAADYRLRVAEWGVWLDDRGDLKLMQSVLDEIPPFVHRSGNSVDSLADRVNQIMMVTKPIIHLTANETMAVDLEVQIRLGRPWFSYPKPDDFNLEVGTVGRNFVRNADGSPKVDAGGSWIMAERPPSPLKVFESTDLPAMTDLREGYPWILPAHRTYGPTGSGPSVRPRNEISAVGLRWQSLVVSPTAPAWGASPHVGSDPKFAWWKRLRDVGTSWVSNRGETERFVYYDGPTRAATPVVIGLEKDRLTFHVRGFPHAWMPVQDAGNTKTDLRPLRGKHDDAVRKFYEDRGLPPNQSGMFSFRGRAQEASEPSKRRGLFIRTVDKHVRVLKVSIPESDGFVDLSSLTESDAHTEGPAILRKMLTEAGLTLPEADGMIDCWRKQFFETAGTRFILLMSPRDYDMLCPLQVHPPPTEMARVGIVLTEFGK